jgi:hypothetical protein
MALEDLEARVGRLERLIWVVLALVAPEAVLLVLGGI